MTATNEPRLTREMIEREILISPKFYGELQRLALIGLATETSGVLEALEWYSDDANFTHDALGNHMATAWTNHNVEIKARVALAKFKEAMGDDEKK